MADQDEREDQDNAGSASAADTGGESNDANSTDEGAASAELRREQVAARRASETDTADSGAPSPSQAVRGQAQAAAQQAAQQALQQAAKVGIRAAAGAVWSFLVAIAPYVLLVLAILAGVLILALGINYAMHFFGDVLFPSASVNDGAASSAVDTFGGF